MSFGFDGRGLLEFLRAFIARNVVLYDVLVGATGGEGNLASSSSSELKTMTSICCELHKVDKDCVHFFWFQVLAMGYG